MEAKRNKFVSFPCRKDHRPNMANAMYDAMWQQAMGDLSEQLNVEGAEDLDDDVNLEEVHEVSLHPFSSIWT